MPEPPYFVERGVQYVHPHWVPFTKACVVEQQPLLDFVVQSLRGPHPCSPYAKDEEYWRKRIMGGDVCVNQNAVIDPSHSVRRNDMITIARRHLHELPVPSGAVDIIYNDDEVVVANKPAGMPVSPDGLNYHFNSLIHIVQHQLGLTESLRPVHRIDTPSSGIVVLAKTQCANSKYSTLIQDRNVKKCYAAKVTGEFPRGRQHVDTYIEFDKESKRYHCVSHRCPGAKRAITTFRLQHYDEEAGASLVLAFPITGRTHQIRLHLQHLGYPIVDDPLYNDEYIAGLPTKVNPFVSQPFAPAVGTALPPMAASTTPGDSLPLPPKVMPAMPAKPGARCPTAPKLPTLPPNASVTTEDPASACGECPWPLLRPHDIPHICLHSICYIFKIENADPAASAAGTKKWLTPPPTWASDLSADVLDALGVEEPAKQQQGKQRQRKRQQEGLTECPADPVTNEINPPSIQEPGADT